MGYLKNKQLIDAVEMLNQHLVEMNKRYPSPPGLTSPGKAYETVFVEMFYILNKALYEIEYGTAKKSLEIFKNFSNIMLEFHQEQSEGIYAWQRIYFAHEFTQKTIEFLESCLCIQASKPLIAYKLPALMFAARYMIDNAINKFMETAREFLGIKKTFSDNEKGVGAIGREVLTRFKKSEQELFQKIQSDMDEVEKIHQQPDKLVSTHKIQVLKAYMKTQPKGRLQDRVKAIVTNKPPSNFKSLEDCLAEWEQAIACAQNIQCEKIPLYKKTYTRNKQGYFKSTLKSENSRNRIARSILNPVELEFNRVITHYELRLESKQIDEALITELVRFFEEYAKSSLKIDFGYKTQMRLEAMENTLKVLMLDGRKQISHADRSLTSSLLKHGLKCNKQEGIPKVLKKLSFEESECIMGHLNQFDESWKSTQFYLGHLNRKVFDEHASCAKLITKKILSERETTKAQLMRRTQLRLRQYLSNRKRVYMWRDGVQDHLEASLFGYYRTEKAIRRDFIKRFNVALRDFLYDDKPHQFFEMLEEGKGFKGGLFSYLTLAEEVKGIEDDLKKTLGEVYKSAYRHVQFGLANEHQL